MEQTATTSKWKVIRLIYLYLVSLIGLVVFLFGGVELVNTGIKAVLGVDDSYYGSSAKQICRDPYQSGVYGKIPAPVAVAPAGTAETVKPVDVNSQEYKDCVKNQEDDQKKQSDNSRRRDIALGLAQMLLGMPVWLYHWMVIQRDHKKNV